jgi:hypothetical protein
MLARRASLQSVIVRLCQLPPNKQLERTVIRRRVRAARASFHYAHAARWTSGHAAAQLRRYATEEVSWHV